MINVMNDEELEQLAELTKIQTDLEQELFEGIMAFQETVYDLGTARVCQVKHEFIQLVEMCRQVEYLKALAEAAFMAEVAVCGFLRLHNLESK